MSNNTVDSKKIEGAKTSDTILVATSPETSSKENKISRYAGKTEFGIIASFGPGLAQYVTTKYEKNTEKDVAKRLAAKAAKNKDEDMTH